MFLPIKQTITRSHAQKIMKSPAKVLNFPNTNKFFSTKSHKNLSFSYILPHPSSSPFASRILLFVISFMLEMFLIISDFQ